VDRLVLKTMLPPKAQIKNQAAEPHFICQRVEDNAFHL